MSKQIKISDLIPDDKNYNKGTEFGGGLIEKSLRKLGAGRSILLDKNNRIIAGNKTIENAGAIGLEDIIVVETTGNQIVAVKRTDIDLDSKKGREMALADNATAKANIEWDYDTLNDDWTVDEQKDWGVVPGFEVALEAQEDDFEVPEGGSDTDIVLGDLFEIGQHRLLCGDSTDSDAVANLMDGQLSDMVFTDPPYGENIDFSYLGWMTKQKHKDEVIKNDELTGQNLSEFLEAINSNILLFNKGASYICSGWKQLPAFQTVFDHNMLIVWNKRQLGFGMGDYRNQTEFILYNKNKASFYGDNSQRNIWEVGRENDNKLHPTIKPIQLLTIPINNNSRERDLILDLFLGSGTTMVAAHQLNRKCYGMELDPKYCQVIIDRMKKLDPTLVIKKNGEVYNYSEKTA